MLSGAFGSRSKQKPANSGKKVGLLQIPPPRSWCPGVACRLTTYEPAAPRKAMLMYAALMRVREYARAARSGAND